MNTDNGKIGFSVELENENLKRQIMESRLEFKKLGNDVAKESNLIDSSFAKIKNTVAGIAAAYSFKELAHRVATVRGEFQQLEVAFKTMLGSKEKANALMNQMVTTAATTPFGLQDVAGGAKQLLAYGVEAEKVNRILIRLGDIAAGLSLPLGDLVYLYGTTKSQGRLYSQDLNQFTGRGIPMIAELAKQFGVAEGKVKELVSEGKVGFPEVEKAIESLTNEGGKFGGLMEAQSKTINGQISNIEDSISTMFNNIGKDNEGLINDVLGGASYLVEHYEQVGRTLIGVAGVYGTYKATVMINVALTRLEAKVVKQAALEKALAAKSGIALSNAEAVASARTKLLSVSTLNLKASLSALNKTMLANPYILVATLIAGIGAAMFAAKTEEERLKDAEEEYQQKLSETISKQEEHRQKLEALAGVAADETLATDTRREALDKLGREYPNIFEKYDTEYEKLKNIKRIKLEIAEFEAGRSMSKPENQLKDIDKQIEELRKSIFNRHYYSKEHKWEHVGEDTRNRIINDYEATSEEKAKLKNLYNNRAKLQKSININNVLTYWDNIRNKGVSDKFLRDQLKSRESLLATMKMRGLKSGKLNPDGVSYSEDELKHTINKINDEINRRGAKRQSSEDWQKTALGVYEKALKAYNDFIDNKDNSLTQEEYDTKLNELKSSMEAAKKAYTNTGGKVKSASDTDKEQKEGERKVELQKRLNYELEDLNQKNEEESLRFMEEGTQKKLKQIDLDYEARKKEIAKQEADWKTENKKAGLGSELSTNQKVAISNAYNVNERKRESSLTEAYDEERQAMLEYLAAYGDFQEKKQAIREQYEHKQRDAESDGERMILAKQMQEALNALELDKLKGDIDWSKVFGNLDEVATKSLESLKNRLALFVKESNELGVDEKKEIIEAINSIDDEIKGRSPFKTLGESMNHLKDANATVTAAQEAYNEALEHGTELEKGMAKSMLETAENAKRKAKAQATTDLHNAAAKGKEYTDAAGSLTNLVQSFGFEAPTWMSDFIGGFDKAFSGLEKIDLMKPMTIVTGAMDTLTGIVGSISSLGGLIDWNGSNAKEVKDTIDRLTDRNEALQTSIEDLTEEMKASRGMKSVGAYKTAHSNQQEVNQNYLEMAEAQAGYHNNHHSWDYYWKGFTGEQIAWIKANVNADFNGDLFSLSPEEMKKLRANVEIWEQIRNTGKGGYGERLTEKLDDYIDQAGKLEELTNQLYEGLTGISFDGMYGSFIDNLMNMKYSAKDAAKDISDYFMKAMLSNQIGEMYADKLKDWYDKFGEAMKNDGTLDESERASLMKEYQSYVEEALKIRDELASATGYDQEAYSQEGSKRGFATASQDSVDELSGRTTAIAIDTSFIKDDVSVIKAQNMAMSENLSEIRGISMIAVERLENIEKNTHELYQINDRLGKIEKNTRNI